MSPPDAPIDKLPISELSTPNKTVYKLPITELPIHHDTSIDKLHISYLPLMQPLIIYPHKWAVYPWLIDNWYTTHKWAIYPQRNHW